MRNVGGRQYDTWEEAVADQNRAADAELLERWTQKIEREIVLEAEKITREAAEDVH